jgi:hypothetical protein
LTVLWTLKSSVVDVEVLGDARQRRADLGQAIDRDAGFAAARAFLLGRLEVFPGAIEPVGLVGAIVLPRLELAFQLAAPVRLELLDFFGGHVTLGDQLFGIELQRRLVRADL